jgi:glycosyltransferase involved in cell wall biosynthesis
MKLLVDGVFFQLAQTGIARVWNSILPRLVAYDDIEIAILDRGGIPDFPGIRAIKFPSHSAEYTAADSSLIERVGRDWGADVFSSTYYTTPTSIPSVLMVYDMIPEVFDFDMSARIWKEKVLAISFARSFCCISEQTRLDLIKYYPDTANRPAVVAHCGVDHDIFRPQSSSGIEAFRETYGLKQPYFLLVGSREQHKGYKNAAIFFDAIRARGVGGFDVVCTGGEREIQKHFLAHLPEGITVKRIDVDDETLARAYSGALALVFPSLYEGFGMPVVEAMACGCPVITTSLGSLKEVAGDAAELISGHDRMEMVRALENVRKPERRAELIELGLKRAQSFSWDKATKTFYDLLCETVAQSTSKSTQRFLAEWKRLREIQAAVDIA